MIETPADILSHHADADAVDSFIAYRKKHKRAALSERGALMIAKSLAAINAAGGDATEALDMAQEFGWSSIKPDWYWRQKHGNGNRHTARDTSADAADRQITFAGSFARAPDRSCF